MLAKIQQKSVFCKENFQVFRYMERVVEYTLRAKEDIAFFKKSRQANILKKIRQLIGSIQKVLLRALVSLNL